MSAQVVWYKRDLRVSDHAPLCEAATRGDCICLYVYEPEIVHGEDFDPSHLTFINESLVELDADLRALGAPLTLRVGRMPEVLERLHREVGVAALWSHQETGTATSRARDARVRDWANHRGIPWTEHRNHGVVRSLPSRDGWAARWRACMQREPTPTPRRVQPAATVEPGRVRRARDLGLGASARTEAQHGGRARAEALLDSFLDSRGVSYRADMSSPVTAWEGCSRLSPYLAWGNVSMREVYHRARRRIDALDDERARGIENDRRWRGSLAAFEQRLRWHCHFIQKLEDEPEIEFRNMSRAYDGLREEEFDESRFLAWREGRTGYPLVDACMRALHRTGWINFRMRAMLVSFASYHLWLHWRPTALHLARCFLDFEPGIHYSQVQMQSGVTGINAVRIYSPIKQVRDQDPEGRFIRRYCPELEAIPDEYLPQPEKMPADVQRRSGCVIGRDYPPPMVEHAQAYLLARRRMHAAKATTAAREEARRVYVKHGSRRRRGGPDRSGPVSSSRR